MKFDFLLTHTGGLSYFHPVTSRADDYLQTTFGKPGNKARWLGRDLIIDTDICHMTELHLRKAGFYILSPIKLLEPIGETHEQDSNTGEHPMGE